jgi:FlaA1/EpsC-like NDP-sugar epimerase
MEVTSAPALWRGRLSPSSRAVILLALYTLCIGVSWRAAYLLRFDFALPAEVEVQSLRLMVWVIGIKLLLLISFRQFASLLSYFSLPDAQRVFFAMLLAACGGYAMHRLGTELYSPPRSVVLADFIISFTLLSALRLSLRMGRERFQRGALPDSAFTRRIGIIGAGDVGASLVKDFLARPGLGCKAVALGDDNKSKWHTSLHGVQVVGSPEYLIQNCARLEIDEVVIAMPSAPAKRVREVVGQLTAHRLKFEQVPSVQQLVNGNVRVSQLRPVELEDLLGRNSVNLQVDRIRELLTGKVVLVTGAGGSIGSELCQQIHRYGPALLLLVERCEVQLFQIEQQLHAQGAGAEFVPLVADILDQKRMKALFARYRPQIVFHAAAHKHVPLMEHQPAEAFQNNTIGSARLADMAVEFGVERFVQISTDKAINPTNVMGATKRMAELYFLAVAEQQTSTRFVAVRFGNVLGSSGSVIPTFKRQIAAGGPVTVTHPDITRYFMTVYEAVGLVLQSAAQAQGGEIYVLDMGKPMKIVDVARQLIELSGFEPNVDIEIKFTGLRPGEKLFEELNLTSENMVATAHPRVMRFVGPSGSLVTARAFLNDLEARAPEMDPNTLKQEFQKLIPEYRPYLGFQS